MCRHFLEKKEIGKGNKYALKGFDQWDKIRQCLKSHQSSKKHQKAAQLGEIEQGVRKTKKDNCDSDDCGTMINFKEKTQSRHDDLLDEMSEKEYVCSDDEPTIQFRTPGLDKDEEEIVYH